MCKKAVLTRVASRGYHFSVIRIRPTILYACVALFLGGKAIAQNDLIGGIWYPSADLPSMNIQEMGRPGGADLFGEHEARTFVEAFLSEHNIPFTRRFLRPGTGGFGISLTGNFAASLTLDAPGETIDTVIVAVPLSSGKNIESVAPGFGVGIALELAALIAAKGSPANTIIAFLADERTELPPDLGSYGERPGLTGLRELTTSVSNPERTVFIYLDPGAKAVQLALRHGSEGTVAPFGVVSALLDAFKRRAIHFPIEMPYNELYRLSLIRGTDSLRFLNESGFQAAAISPSRPFGMNARGIVPSEKEVGLALYDSLHELAKVPVEADRRYALLGLGLVVLPVPENMSISLFIAVAALSLGAFLTYSLTHRYLLMERWRVFTQRSWAVLLFFLILFCGIRLSGLILDLVLSGAGVSSTTIPYGAASIKLLLSFGLYYLVSLFSDRLPIPHHAHYYGTAASVCLAIGALIAAALDFTYVPLVLWAFTFAFISSSFHSYSLAFLSAFIAPIQIVGALACAAGSGEPGLALTFLSGKPLAELYAAFIILPFLLLSRRGSILMRSRLGTEKRSHFLHQAINRTIFISGNIIALVVFSREVVLAEMKRPVALRETLDGTTRTLDYAEHSFRPVGMLVSDSFGYREAPTEDILPPELSTFFPLEISSTEQFYLDRRLVRLSIKSFGRPARIDLSMGDGKPLSIYSSPVPYRLSADGHTAFLALGEQPPNPLELDLTLSAETAVIFKATAHFTTSPVPILTEPEYPLEYVLSVSAYKRIGE